MPLQCLIDGSFEACMSRLGFHQSRLVQNNEIAILKKDILSRNTIRVKGQMIKVKFNGVPCFKLRSTTPHTPAVDMNTAEINNLFGPGPGQVRNRLGQSLVKTFLQQCRSCFKSVNLPFHGKTIHSAAEQKDCGTKLFRA